MGGDSGETQESLKGGEAGGTRGQGDKGTRREGDGETGRRGGRGEFLNQQLTNNK